METVTTVAELQRRLAAARRGGRTVGFVPTMGALHEGHLSLVRRAGAENDDVVVSVFVNPRQFGPGEDFERYPREPEHDAALLEGAGARYLFLPSVEEIYPPGFATTVSVDSLAEMMCGLSRPGHFAGVATVVARLFGIVGECRAYFGEKDYQQLAIVKRMARDLALPVEVTACETVREPDGLAMSSRNVYLTDAQRAAAPALSRALEAAARAIREGEREPGSVRREALAVLDAEPLWTIEYVEVRDAETLADVGRVAAPVVIAAAGRLGKTRLIDNVVVAPPEPAAS
jgi:pantoate--beta-alanine ligase